MECPTSALGTTAVSVASVALVATAACGTGNGPAAAPDPTYENVASVIARSCTFEESCHGGEGDGQAGLHFGKHADFRRAWLTESGDPRSACGYDGMPVVDPGNPDNSWLLVKLEGPFDKDGRVVPGTWGPSGGWARPSDADCADFGVRMPQGEDPLPAAEVAMIRAWVALGTPGTTGDGGD